MPVLLLPDFCEKRVRNDSSYRFRLALHLLTKVLFLDLFSSQVRAVPGVHAGSVRHLRPDGPAEGLHDRRKGFRIG